MQDRATRELKALIVGSSVKPPGIAHHPLPLLDGHGHQLRKITVQYEYLFVSVFYLLESLLKEFGCFPLDQGI